MSSGTTARDRDHAHLLEVIEPIVRNAGFDLETLVVTAAGRRSQVRVVIDGDEGVSLDDIALVSKAVSTVLDETDAVMGSSPYTLEVTSPGVDRTLTEPRHWRRATGRLVRFTLDGKTSEGRVLEVDETGVRLDLGQSEQRHPIANLLAAKVQVEFSRPREHPESGAPKWTPGSAKKNKASSVESSEPDPTSKTKER